MVSLPPLLYHVKLLKAIDGLFGFVHAVPPCNGRKRKEKGKVYAVRRHSGSLGLKRQPECNGIEALEQHCIPTRQSLVMKACNFLRNLCKAADDLHFLQS